jgi:hypothetical protein
MNPLVISLISLVIDRVNARLVATGRPPLTDEDVALMKQQAIDEGQAAIVAWFLAKGLPVPD